MAEPVTLKLTITNDNGTPKRDHADPNNPGKYLHPVLHKNDTLQLHTTTAAWPTGITEIKFFKTKADYTAGTSFASWTPGATEVKKGATKVFSVTEVKSGAIVTDVNLKDAETLASGEDDMYYQIMLGTTPLDPEIVNKSGTGTGRNEDHWVAMTP